MKANFKYKYGEDSEFWVTKIDGDDIYISGTMFGKYVLDWIIKKGSLMELMSKEV